MSILGASYRACSYGSIGAGRPAVGIPARVRICLAASVLIASSNVEKGTKK